MSLHNELIINESEFEEPQPRRKLPWKPALGVLAIFAVAVGAFLLYNLLRVTALPLTFGHLKGESTGRVNIMLLGVGDPGHDGGDLSDTNILLSVNTKTHQIATISIPRDTRVKIPGYGSGKINLANSNGGTKAAETVMQNTLGVPVDYYLRANFTGLKSVVDAVGGVDIDNTDLLYDPEYPCDNNQYRSCGFKLKPGRYHLDGTTALKYVRCRKGTCGDDFGRATRQQQVMQAIRANATTVGTLGNPLKLGKLIAAVGDNIKTDLSINNLLRLNDLTKKTDKSNTISVVFNLDTDGFLVASNTSSDLLPASGDFGDIQNFVQKIFTLGPIWTEHPTVMIQNGTVTPGIASKLQQTFVDSEYDIMVNGIANAATHDNLTTQIIDYTAGKKPHTLGYVSGLLGVKATAPTSTVASPPADIVIILGQDYATKVQSTSANSGSSATTSN